jgi:RNA polymerase sigma-70 factor (ECF subfamily)
MRQLTREQQDCIALRFFMSMSTRETADILGKTENATAVLQVRAIAALRRHLSDAAISGLISSKLGASHG